MSPPSVALLTVIGGLLAFGMSRAQDPQALFAQALLQKYDCNTCHGTFALDAVGPRYVDIATKYQTKYRSDAAAVAAVVAIIQNGRSTSGLTSMPPHRSLPDDDAKTIAEYIVSLKR